jgi:hypothetical protein
MSPSEAAWLAWYMCTVSVTLTALGLSLLVVSRSPGSAPVYAGAPVFDYWLVNAVIVVSFSTVGAVVAPASLPTTPWAGSSAP